jgi:SMI1 / KNR4 family (SUKH-1)
MDAYPINLMRLRCLEERLGIPLPEQFVMTLTGRKPVREGGVAIVCNDCVWDVRNTLSLDDGDPNDQLDRVYELVREALPHGALPIAQDWGGNLYCLMLLGPEAGQVVWWHHERTEGDQQVMPVATSVADFYSRLIITDPCQATPFT